MPLIAPPFSQPTPDPRGLRADLDRVIVSAILDDPRSQQTLLGPSEMGCPRCIARHFMGIEKLPEKLARTPEAAPWLPWVGTALHTQLEHTFHAENERLAAGGDPPRWLMETRVPVGIINGRYLSGSMDLFDTWTGTVIDWKLVGTTKMTKVKRHNHPGGIYRPQAHIYGRGMTLLGHPVHTVAIYFLPRNAISLSQGYFWTEPYNPQLAQEAIDTVQKIAEMVAAADPAQYNEILAKLKSAGDDCFSCDDYPPLGDEGTDKQGLPVHPSFSQPTPYAQRG